MMLRISLLLAVGLFTNIATAQDTTVSVEKGARIAVIGGCHDCHTVNYAETGGQIDPSTALTGNPVGYQGPWGTNYAPNLRILAAGKSEDEWVKYLQTFQAGPPMPWFNVHALREDETRSLHQYILSLGEPGAPAPKDVPPGGKVTTPFLVFAPPTMPPA